MFDRRDALQVGALRAAHDPEPVVLRHGALEHRERRLHERDVDDLAEPAACDVAPVDRGEDPLHREHPGERVAEREVHARRRLAGIAVQVAQPAHRLGDRGEARALGVRPGLPVAGDPREDHARVDLAHPVVADPPALERPGPEVLDDDVGMLDEPQEQLLPARLAQVERDALLVPRLHGPPQRAALVAGLAPLADRVRLPGRLDLDDLGAEVAEQPAGERARRAASRARRPAARRAARRPVARRRRHALAARSGPRPRSASSASMCCTSTSRASKTCSRITSSARSPSPRSSAFTSCRW